jgi:Mn-dependent DtxR family transcriptional regulator
VLRFQDGASREHCSDEACRLAHGVSAALRNRINSKFRMRLIRAMGGV